MGCSSSSGVGGEVVAAQSSRLERTSGSTDDSNCVVQNGLVVCDFGSDVPAHLPGLPAPNAAPGEFGACYFTRIVGFFHSEDDSVEIGVGQDSKWHLYLQRRVGEPDIEARMECVRGLEFEGFANFTATTNYPVSSALIPAKYGGSQGPCVLSAHAPQG